MVSNKPGNHEGKRDGVVPLGRDWPSTSGSCGASTGLVAASWNTSSQIRPISIKPTNNITNHMLDGPALTLTGVRLTGLIVKSFFLRTLDLGMGTFEQSASHGVTMTDDPNASDWNRCNPERLTQPLR